MHSLAIVLRVVMIIQILLNTDNNVYTTDCTQTEIKI